MSFIERLEARENIFLKKLEECKKSGLKTYIWGNGLTSNFVELEGNNFKFDGKLINKSYYSENSNNIYCFEDIFENTEEKINLIIGFTKYNDSLIEKYKDKINLLIDCDCTQNFWLPNNQKLDYSFVINNDEKLENIYINLADEKSKLSLLAFINQKISKEKKYLKSIYENNQYFPENIIKLNNNEIFLDCGAYIGDTAKEFANQIKKQNVTYKKIISFEPNPINFNNLKITKLNNHECYNIGTSNHKEIIKFSTNTSYSCFDNNGDIKVEVNTIDNVVKDDVTFIKMDIEGMN